MNITDEWEKAKDVLRSGVEDGALEIGAVAMTESVAREEAEELSSDHANKVFRVYLASSSFYWVRQDNKPILHVDGTDLAHIAAYLNGEEIKP